MSTRLLTSAEVVGITGDEPPLTDADVHDVIARAYTPWHAWLVLQAARGDIGDWARGHMRPTSRGSFGTGPDDVFRAILADARGWNVRYSGDRWARAGHIAWSQAERRIRDRATPATAAALDEAVRADLAAARSNDTTEGVRTYRAARAAWRALINPPTAPEQLDLFAGVV